MDLWKTFDWISSEADSPGIFVDNVAAVAPFVESGGTAVAFVTDPGEEISPTIIDWAEGYVPAQIGEGNKRSQRTEMHLRG
jgi:hypothetical protein